MAGLGPVIEVAAIGGDDFGAVGEEGVAGVGAFASEHLEGRRRAGLEPERRMGLLQRPDVELDVVVLVELALEAERLIRGEGGLDDGQRLVGEGGAVIVVGVVGREVLGQDA